MSSTTLVVEAITDQPTGGEIDPSLSGVRVFLDREAILGGHLSPTLFTTAVVKPWGWNGLRWVECGLRPVNREEGVRKRLKHRQDLEANGF